VVCWGNTYRQRFRGRACLFSQASQSSPYSSRSTLSSEARVKAAILDARQRRMSSAPGSLLILLE
jgi:hypothetical protein